MQSQPPASSGSPVYPLRVANAGSRYGNLILEPEPLQWNLPQSHFSSVRNETPGEALVQTPTFPFLSEAAPGSLKLEPLLCQTQSSGHAPETTVRGII